LKTILWAYFYINLLLGFIFLCVAIISYYAAFVLIKDGVILTLDKQHFKSILDTLPAIGILIGGQIAGLSVYLNIKHSNEQKEKDKMEEYQKSNKVLASYFSHFDTLSKAHILGLNKLHKDIQSCTVLTEKALPTQIKNDLMQLKQELQYNNLTIETMLNFSFSKHAGENTIKLLLTYHGMFIFAIYTLDRIGKDLNMKDILSNIEAMIVSISYFKKLCQNR
jgi:hypothetical protein